MGRDGADRQAPQDGLRRDGVSQLLRAECETRREGSSERPFLKAPKTRVGAGIALYIAVTVLGVYLHSHPGPTIFDREAFRILPDRYYWSKLTYVAELGRARTVAVVCLVSCIIAFGWDRRRALTCIAGPPAAIGITELIAKPAVGRMFGGLLCYPSGHMTAVASIVGVVVIAFPPRFRKAMFVVGVLVCIVVGVVLMLLRWHYLTDVIAGASVAIATLLIVDTILHVHPEWGFGLQKSHARRPDEQLYSAGS